MPAKKTAEQIAHEQKLLARRNRRARKKAEQTKADEALAVETAETIRLDAASKGTLPAMMDARILGEKQQVLAGRASPKRITEAREHLSLAFDELGGVAMLVAWGTRNLTEFYRLWARLIPKEEVTDKAKGLPLEDLLDKLAARADQSVTEAARAIGEEALAEAEREVNLEDAVAAFNGGSVH